MVLIVSIYLSISLCRYKMFVFILLLVFMFVYYIFILIFVFVIAANGCEERIVQLQHVGENPDPDVQQDLLLQLHQPPRGYAQWSKAVA